MSEHNAVKPEFSVAIELASLSRTGKEFRLKADQTECAAIAKRLGVMAVDALEGEIRLTATQQEIAATGSVRAVLLRECVASLEKMTETVCDTFATEFVRQAPENIDADDQNIWADAPILEDSVFDIGELLVQQLSLAMTPFPRKQGVVSLADKYGQMVEASPFAILRDNAKKSK